MKKSKDDAASSAKEPDVIEVEKQQIVQSILTYDVLRLIFQYLGAKDLDKVATLCRKVYN